MLRVEKVFEICFSKKEKQASINSSIIWCLRLHSLLKWHLSVSQIFFSHLWVIQTRYQPHKKRMK